MMLFDFMQTFRTATFVYSFNQHLPVRKFKPFFNQLKALILVKFIETKTCLFSNTPFFDFQFGIENFIETKTHISCIVEKVEKSSLFFVSRLPCSVLKINCINFIRLIRKLKENNQVIFFHVHEKKIHEESCLFFAATIITLKFSVFKIDTCDLTLNCSNMRSSNSFVSYSYVGYSILMYG